MSIVDIDLGLQRLRRRRTDQLLNEDESQSGVRVEFARSRIFKNENGVARPVSADDNGGDDEDGTFPIDGDGLHCSGRTVRELSRLWRYMGGNSPED